VGCTPWQYVLERRLQAAEPLLRQGMPADDVARRVGLVNAARLSRLFRQRRGVGLSQWRRLDGGPG
jgi:AraC-like DNA-binding protein